MTVNKPLLVILQPRDIPQFVNHFYRDMARMKYDRLIIKYTKPDIAYHAARKIFLDDYPEYTHYIYGTDDILFSEHNIDRMIADYNYSRLSSVNAVIASDMNLDMENQNTRGFMLAEYKLPHLGMDLSHNVMASLITREMYHFAEKGDPRVVSEASLNNGLVQCSWSALPLAIIPRPVIEATTFDNDLQYVNHPKIDHIYGCCIDLVFGVECARHGFPIYTNMNVSVLHIKPSVAKNLWYEEYSKVGIKAQEWFILKAGTDERIEVVV